MTRIKGTQVIIAGFATPAAERQVYQDPNVPRPSENIPPPAAPKGPSGVEKAQTFLNRSLESILQQHSPENLGKAGMFLDLKQPMREALKGPFGGQILSGLQPKLGGLGLTRSDLAKAIADPRARFGGGFGGSMGGELPTAGSFSPYPDFRQSADSENRSAEQSSRDQLAALQARGTSYEPGPEVAPSILSTALGLSNLPTPADTAGNVIGPRSSAFGFEPGGFGEGGYGNVFAPNAAAASAPEEFTPTRLASERAPSLAAEEMWLRYGGVGNADIGPPQYSGFEQPYGPEYQPGEYMREQFKNHADFTLQDQAEDLPDSVRASASSLSADPELRRNTIAMVLAEMGQNQSDAGRLKLIESMLNRLGANQYPTACIMLGYRNAAGQYDPQAAEFSGKGRPVNIMSRSGM